MTPETLSEVMEATWPAVTLRHTPPVTLRDGLGGGKRVSAATVDGPFTEADLDAAEAAMRAMGQAPLFLIRAGEEALDAALAARGWAVVDPVVAYAAPVSVFEAPPHLTAFPHWPPLGIVAEIWQEGGIGPARRAVMERASGPKCALLGRCADRPAAAAFVALHGDIAMLHALEVTPDLRRQGTGRHVIQAAARWAAGEGATQLALVVTDANQPARAFYVSLGFQLVGQYHYRQA